MRIAFIGAGRMAGAMIRGLLKSGCCAPGEITCTSADDGTGQALAAELGIGFSTDADRLLDGIGVLVLACKPQQLDDLDPAIAKGCKGKLVLSILAGVTAACLQSVLPEARVVVRAMPNTPGLVGAGVTVYADNALLTAEDRESLAAILGALGEVYVAPEADLDAVTGLSGSGPAYVFEMVAALRDGGIAEGLDPELALALAIKTVRGAAELLEKVPEKPETHRDWVSSPGGTTLAGLAVMKKKDFRGIIAETVSAATRRSRELAGGFANKGV